MLFVFTLGRLSSWRLLFLRKRWVNDDSSAIEEQTLKLNYIAQHAEYEYEKYEQESLNYELKKMWPGWCCCCWGPTWWGSWGGPPHQAQRWECCCTPSGASPVNSNSIHTYTATTSGTAVRMLLHAFRCVTCQQQHHSFIHSHHIRHRGESVVARLQVWHLSTATAFIHTQPPHLAQRWEWCCTLSGESPANSNSIHSYCIPLLIEGWGYPVSGKLQGCTVPEGRLCCTWRKAVLYLKEGCVVPEGRLCCTWRKAEDSPMVMTLVRLSSRLSVSSSLLDRFTRDWSGKRQFKNTSSS